MGKSKSTKELQTLNDKITIELLRHIYPKHFSTGNRPVYEACEWLADHVGKQDEKWWLSGSWGPNEFFITGWWIRDEADCTAFALRFAG